MDCKKFEAYLTNVNDRVLRYINSSDVQRFLRPQDIKNSVLSYIRRPAKRLRPAVLLMACGCLGGDKREKIAIPAAAGVELFHTWTLVHDDIIDKDDKRRGKPTVHRAIADSYKKALGDALAEEYGRDIAILTGDMQHGWSIAAFIDCALKMHVNPTLVLAIIRRLQSYVLGNLIFGEVEDVNFGMRSGLDMSDIDDDRIVHMLWLKTGVLYEFAGWAGSLIGKNSEEEDKCVEAIKEFCSICGTAFQLQDDILGIVGDEKKTGKPRGSDIREGKKTLIVYYALKNAHAAEKSRILSILGKEDASEDEINEIEHLFHKYLGIEETKKRAKQLINEAKPKLTEIPDSRYKELLISWADHMIDRDL